MLRRKVFYLLAISLSIFLGFIFLEIGVRALDLVNPKSVWLQITDRGYYTNQKGGTALHTFDDRRVIYNFTEIRTRGNVSPNQPNIFVFGDSFTFGLLVEDEDTFVSHLNRLSLEEFDSDSPHFVNAGVGGSGLADWVAKIEESADTLPMDGILFVLNYDDFARALHSNLFIVDDDGNLLHRSRRWKQKDIKNRLDRSSLFQTLQERLHTVSGLYSFLYTRMFTDLTKGFSQNDSKVPVPTQRQLASFDDYNITLAEFLFSRTKEIADSLEIPFWITTTGFIDFDFINTNRFFNEYVFTRLDSIAYTLDIPYHDITEDFKIRIDERYIDAVIPNEGHPNEFGNESMAQEIFNFLRTVVDH